MKRFSIKRFLLISSLISILVVWALMIISDELLGHYQVEAGLYVLIIGLPVLALSLWMIVGYGLRALKDLSKEITKRASTNLQPIDENTVPKEIKPIVKDLNILFKHLKEALIKNKRFASDAAHELRTPLAAIKLQAQVAMNSNDPDELRAALQHLVVGVDRSTHIVDQLLTLSRLGPEATLKDMQSVNLESLAAEIIAMLVPKALDKNIEIELHPDARHKIIYANEISMAILIRNLVDNGIRYTPNDGSVKVYLTNDTQNNLILSVIDSGIGIPEELHDRVFERFFRVLGTETLGSGLGLAIVKQICDLHGAIIQLNTPANGKGLQVDITFKSHKP